MGVTLTSVITYPLPGLVPVVGALTGGGNYWRAWCLTAPIGSKLRTKLDADVSGRILVAEGGDGERVQLELDVGGAYTFAAQEYTKGATTYGGGYHGSPDGATTEVKVGIENHLTLYVGQRMVCRINAPGYGGADVVVHCWNAHIRPTTLAVHGEATPAIINPSEMRAAVAAQNATFVATLATLADQPAATVIGALDTLCAELRLDVPNHFNNSGGAYHQNSLGAVPDTDHDTAIENLQATPTTVAGFVAFFNTVRANLAAHMANQGHNYHSGAAFTPNPDYTHALLAPLPASAGMSDVLAAAGDIVSQYNAHIADATHHAVADAANNITTALGQLVQVHRDFIAAMRPLSPTAPATFNAGAVALAHGAGFVEKSKER